MKNKKNALSSLVFQIIADFRYYFKSQRLVCLCLYHHSVNLIPSKKAVLTETFKSLKIKPIEVERMLVTIFKKTLASHSIAWRV